jgi:hypothetical protein
LYARQPLERKTSAKQENGRESGPKEVILNLHNRGPGSTLQGHNVGFLFLLIASADPNNEKKKKNSGHNYTLLRYCKDRKLLSILLLVPSLWAAQPIVKGGGKMGLFLESDILRNQAIKANKKSRKENQQEPDMR